jgi:hypothetical protein
MCAIAKFLLYSSSIFDVVMINDVYALIHRASSILHAYAIVCYVVESM